MAKWETLKLTTITLPMKHQYFWLIPFMLVMFLLTYGLIACIIDDCAGAGTIHKNGKVK